jgi:hypothetical protein
MPSEYEKYSRLPGRQCVPRASAKAQSDMNRRSILYLTGKQVCIEYALLVVVIAAEGFGKQQGG